MFIFLILFTAFIIFAMKAYHSDLYTNKESKYIFISVIIFIILFIYSISCFYNSNLDLDKYKTHQKYLQEINLDSTIIHPMILEDMVKINKYIKHIKYQNILNDWYYRDIYISLDTLKWNNK